MKRKIFSTLLMGAFVFASLSTVTSCKDYDDDINGLQTELASLKSSVSTLESNVSTATSTANSALSEAQTAKTTAESALAKANAAATQADLDALKARVTAAEGKITSLETEIKKLDDLQSQITDLKAKVENCATKEELAALKAEFDALQAQFDALYQMVTSVSIVGSFTADGYHGEAPTVAALTGVVPNSGFVAEFGKKEIDDLKGEHKANTVKTYAKGAQFGFADDFLIRVSPVNATVTPEMIKLVDSKGNDLTDVLEISKVEKYDELLTRASGNATGLWKVSATPKKNYTDLNKTVLKGDKHVLYAVQVCNTDSAADRYVTSSYDLAIDGQTWGNNAEITLHNVKVSSETTTKAAFALSEAKSREVAFHKGSSVVTAATGEKVIVDFSALKGQAQWFYVVRDDKHAGESDASEINAWNAYEYTGLNTIYSADEKGYVTVTIPSTAKAGDEIVFRVFAVKYDGQYVAKGDNETGTSTGHSFSVYVAAKTNEANVSGNLVATSKNPSTDILAINNASVLTSSNALPSTVELYKDENTSYTFNVTYYKDAEGKQPVTKSSESKYAKFTLASDEDVKNIKDGSTITGALTIKGSNQEIIDNVTVSLTKVLPGDAEAKELGKYTWKGEQLSADNVFTAYLFDNADGNVWTPGAGSFENGYKLMNDVLNIGNPITYVIENAAVDASKSSDKQVYDQALSVNLTTEPSVLKVSNNPDSKGNVLIDNKTEHASKILYNFGKVSSESNNDVTGVVSEFKTVFACPLAKDAQPLTWKQYAQAQGTSPETYKDVDVNWLTWGIGTSAYKVEIGDYIVAANTFDPSKFSGTFDGSTYVSKTSGVSSLYASVKAELLTNSNNNPDYFTVEYKEGKLVFTPVANAQNPLKDVASTLKLTLKDQFGHEMVYELPFTVKPSANGAKKH